MNKSLFHIAQDYLVLADTLEQNGGEITPDIEELLSINKDQLQTKGVNYALVVRQLLGESEMIDKEIERLTKMKKAKEGSVDRLKHSLKSAMELYGIESIKGDFIQISLRKGREVVQIDNEDSIPKKYINKKITTAPDKKAIKEAIESGITVKGAFLKTGEKSLIIK